jgi:hypothetical protein
MPSFLHPDKKKKCNSSDAKELKKARSKEKQTNERAHKEVNRYVKPKVKKNRVAA